LCAVPFTAARARATGGSVLPGAPSSSSDLTGGGSVLSDGGFGFPGGGSSLPGGGSVLYGSVDLTPDSGGAD
jgi:hypothetical protein